MKAYCCIIWIALPVITLNINLWLFIDKACAQTSTWKVPEEANELESPLENSAEIITAGKQMYVQLCAVCHGNAGQGDGITAAALKPKPSNLTSKAVQEQSNGAIYWKISEGRPPMPSFKSQLSEQQRWALVLYFRTLNPADLNQ